MCDRDSYAWVAVEIKINGSEPGVIRLEATGCHFVRKERRNSMARLKVLNDKSHLM